MRVVEIRRLRYISGMERREICDIREEKQNLITLIFKMVKVLIFNESGTKRIS